MSTAPDGALLILVTDCGGCPFARDVRGTDGVCAHPASPPDEQRPSGDEVPDWCPLRSQHVAVRLEPDPLDSIAAWEETLRDDGGGAVTLIPRGDRFERDRWWSVRRGDGTRSASIACPECGRHASLLDHSIAPDGTVSPSVVCPHPGCTWHVFVRLDGWTP